MNSFSLKTLLALLLIIALSISYFFLPKSVLSFDNKLRDFLFVMRGELPKSDSVVIVDIDEKALKQLGQWPWSRDIFAELITRLGDAKAKIIGLDIVFAEDDRTSPHKFKSYNSNPNEKLANYDEMLAKSFASTLVVGGYVFTDEESSSTAIPIIPAQFLSKGESRRGWIDEFDSVTINIPILQNALSSSGFFNNSPDEGGMIRNMPLIIPYKGVIYPSLALEMVRLSSNNTKVIVEDNSISFGDYKIPIDSKGELTLNIRGAKKHFNYISIADIMDGSFNPNNIKDKFVLIGTSAMGLVDLRATVFDKMIPEVEIHANMIDNILSADFLRKPSEQTIYNIFIMLFVVIISMIIFSIIKSWAIIPVAIILVYLFFKIFYALLFDYGIVLNLFFPMIAFLSTLFLSISIDYLISSRQKEEAKRMLGKKVSVAVMDYLLEHSAEEMVISKEVEATVFFSDIRSFTQISETIGSPDRLIKMLNQYMTPMVDSIMKYNGTIDKFIGDAIMAYWNAPLEIPQHADKALKSAIAQIEMLEDINREIQAEYNVTIKIGIGLHTGKVTAGDMGSEGRSDYTIIGDNVNLASRLEGLTKQYGADILISNATYTHLTDIYNIRPIDLVKVKGKSEAIEIFEVICDNKNISHSEIEEYKKAIDYFRDAKVEDAYDIFVSLQLENPSKLYKFYIERCKSFMDNPDREFTAILKMTTK
ncbi:MAG: adenylate/guanylate cyclase domain-containing protein [Sulfurovum sp.]